MTAPVATLAARFSADGSETVRRAIASVSQAAQQSAREQARVAADAAKKVAASQAAAALQTQNKYGQMALSAASSFNAITWSGKVSGEALKNIFQQTALVGATLFGAGGPVVAAVAVAGMAMSNIFTRAADEAKRAREAIDRELRLLDRSRDPRAANQRLTDLIVGNLDVDPEKDPMRAAGIARLEAERDRILASRRRELAGGGVTFDLTRAETLRVNALREAIKELRAEYDRILPRVTAINQDAAALAAATAARKATADAAAAVAAPAGPRAPGARSASTVGDRPNTGGAVRVPLPDPTEIVTATQDALIAEFTKRQSTLSQGIAATIGGGLAAGISAAIMSGDVGTAIKSIGTTVLAGLGDIFAQIAAKAIAQATLMTKFMAFLTANPIAAVAVAVSMMALARSMGGGRGAPGVGAGVGSFGGAGRVAGGSATESVTRLIFGNNSVATAAGMTPRQAINFTVIGPNDPTAQRAIADIVRKAEGRGLLGGMG